MIVEGFDAADPARISAREVLDEWSGPASVDGPTFRPAAGYDNLLQSIRRGLRAEHAELRFGTVVRSVTWGKAGVEVEALSHGEIVRIRAARAIVTVPLGVLQLFHSVNAGYFEARSLGYITKPGNALLEWMRLPGDLIVIVGGVLPFCWIAWIALRNFRSGETVDELPEHPLYTTVTVAEDSETEG